MTLSGDITRDKTVQSCMRMRQLGNGHSINFLASHEADVRLRKILRLSSSTPPTNKHVIEFVEHNSKQLERGNMVHWAAAALNYAKKTIGHAGITKAENDDHEKLKKIHDTCVDKEFINLSEMYDNKAEVYLKDIIWTKFGNLTREITDFELTKHIQVNIQNTVQEKILKYAGDVKRFSHALDEEQEKELEIEQELEEKRHMDRPPTVRPAVPVFNKQLKRLVDDGVTDEMLTEMKEKGSLVSIAESLSRTQLNEFCERNKNAWAEHLLVTKDFRLVRSSEQDCDDYLRPVWWILRIHTTQDMTKYILVLLSSFECHHLLPSFRISKNATLYMYRPCLNRWHSNLLDIKELWVTGMDEKTCLNVNNQVQIGMYAGSMYFKSDAECEAYCKFMGLIPKPWDNALERAFDNGYIQSKGFVKPDDRHLDSVARDVNGCKFNDNPVDLAIKFIEIHHQTLQRESHVASLFRRGVKPLVTIKNENHFSRVRNSISSRPI